MQTVLDEITEKFLSLSVEERKKMMRLSEEQERRIEPEYKKSVSPNIEWLKIHRAEYAGNYVALKDGELIAFGKTIKEADLRAKEKGVKKTLLHYIPAEDEEVWGGW
jgi:hypothetical protein